jgi:phosphate-selective porin OprO/OprP
MKILLIFIVLVNVYADKYIKKRAKKYSYDRYLSKLESKKGRGNFDYKYKFGAQISYDISYIDEADKKYTPAGWRRVRVYHKGSFIDEKLFYELEYSLTGENKYKDIYVGYKDKTRFYNTSYRIKFGNIKIPFSLESYTSSKYIMFMERALTDAFSQNRKLGAEILLSNKFNNSRVNLFTSFFSNSIDEKNNNELEKNGYSMRLTYAHRFHKKHIVSIGYGVMQEDMNDIEVKINQSSESDWMDKKYVSVKIQNVDSVNRSNIEFLYINKKYSIQSEYVTTSVNALKDSYTFDAYYIEGSYFVIGNGRRYKFSNSTLAKIKPNKDGALEVAFRYSYIDLNDKDESGGVESDYNFGVNWYINDKLKFMLNYVVAEPKNTDDYDGRLQILQARALFSF